MGACQYTGGFAHPMKRDQALGAIERALSFSAAEHATVRLSGADERATRFANNAITQNVAANRLTLSVTAAFGQKVGTASTNQLDEAALRDTVRRAEESARASDPDPEYLPPLAQQDYPTVGGYDEATAETSADERARMARELVRGPAESGDRAAGSVTTRGSFLAVANSAGLRAYHADTDARLVTTVLSDGASGWAGRGSYDVARLPVAELAERAARKAREARNPEEAPARPTTVILEPQALADLVAYLVWDLEARAMDEGRSAFSGLEGQQIVDPSVTIRSVPNHTDMPGMPFADDGAATRDVAWIRDGVLESVKTSRFWAEKTGRARVDFPGNIVMDGGDVSTEDLIAQVEDGLLVTRFWYIRSVDPMKLLLTGMTRDGLYRIRDGKVAGGAVNMRFNESPIRMLKNVAALGRPVPTRDAIVAPPALVNDFHFTSVTRF